MENGWHEYLLVCYHLIKWLHLTIWEFSFCRFTVPMFHVSWCLMSAVLRSQDKQFKWQSGWHPVTNDLPLVVTLCRAVKIKKPIDIMCLPPKESTVPWKNHDKTFPQAKGPSGAAFAALISLIAEELINASSTHLSIFYHCLSCTQGHRDWCQSQLICSKDRVHHGHVLSVINT